MKTDFNPDMLILARQLRGITQTKLAELTDIPQGNISKYEGGLHEIKQSHLESIAQTLGFTQTFFYRDGSIRALESAEVFHRKRQSISSASLSKLDAAVNLLRLDVQNLFKVADVEYALTIPQYRPNEYENDVEHIAAMVRAAWDIPSGPVRNLVAYMEAAGCVILLMNFETDKMDAVSQWKDLFPPVMLMSDSISGERQRFSLAHELGHLVMHRNLEPYPNMEAEADRFASAFLMPANSIAAELPPVSIEHMLQIKPSWKVSVQALIRRARDLDVITERRYTSLFQGLSRMGYRTVEPFPLPAEQPTLLSRLLKHLQDELEYTVDDIAAALGLHEDDLRTRYYREYQGIHLVPRPKNSKNSSRTQRSNKSSFDGTTNV